MLISKASPVIECLSLKSLSFVITSMSISDFSVSSCLATEPNTIISLILSPNFIHINSENFLAVFSISESIIWIIVMIRDIIYCAGYGVVLISGKKLRYFRQKRCFSVWIFTGICPILIYSQVFTETQSSGQRSMQFLRHPRCQPLRCR